MSMKNVFGVFERTYVINLKDRAFNFLTDDALLHQCLSIKSMRLFNGIGKMSC